MSSFEIAPGAFVSDETLIRLTWDGAAVPIFLEPDEILDEGKATLKLVEGWRQLQGLLMRQGVDLKADAVTTQRDFAKMQADLNMSKNPHSIDISR